MLSKLLRKGPSEDKPLGSDKNQSASRIAIGIPGKWDARIDVAEAMVRQGYMLVDMPRI